MRVPGVPVEELLKRVRAGVKQQTNGEQVPWESSSLVGDFYFNRAASASGAARNSTGGTIGGPAAATAAFELEYWNAIKDSNDPEEYNGYLKRYPNGQFAEIARRRAQGTRGGNNSAAAPAGVHPAAMPGVVVRNQLGMELVYMPAGSFMMGSEKGRSNEKPVHRVMIREGFYMGRYEVTQAQWQSVMDNNPSYFKGENNPVEQVSWDDAVAFINKLNEMNDGYKYRLPTEAEWEYACRAGTTGDYAGDLDEIAWYKDNSGKATHPVGQKQPNAFGLYDMHGNVWEWCQDYWHDNYNGAPTDGSVWSSGGNSSERVLRGGSWVIGGYDLRSAGRIKSAPAYPYIVTFGFRVAASARSS
jgi:formylglycine-generating enzyme required for sulfatase activity